MFETTIDGFYFELSNGICIVTVDEKEYARFSTLSPTGLPTIGSQQEFEQEAMWWLYKNVQV
jgi:hypothetical protein